MRGNDPDAPLSDYARRRKREHSLRQIPKDARLLEAGCGDGRVRKELSSRGWKDYRGTDLRPPAGIVGSIRERDRLGFEPDSPDVVIAFESVEHVPCCGEMFALPRPGNLLMPASPLPHMDWLCRVLELLGLNQKRTSPHEHLIYFSDIPLFDIVELKTVGLMAQWGIFRKPLSPGSRWNRRARETPDPPSAQS